jgi:hypothetical protein
VPELAVTAVGADRPGIIARVTRVLYEHGGNLEDSSMTILGGHFAIMLLVDAPTDAATLETGAGTGNPRPRPRRDGPPGRTWVATAVRRPTCCPCTAAIAPASSTR